MTPLEVYNLARSEGLSSERALVATAVALPESGLNPTILGDENLEDEKYGPSVGLWQIRSLRAQLGTGGERDALRLVEPAFNAKSMASISKGGSDFSPWTCFRNGDYLMYLGRVRGAVFPTKEEAMPTELMPTAENWIRRGNSNMVGGPSRATHHITWDVLHSNGTRAATLEGVSNYLLSVGYEPHLVIDPFTGETIQLLEATSSGFALENRGVQTNRRGEVNIQIEWFFTPGTVYDGVRYDRLTDTPMRGLAELMAWCDSWGIPRVAPLGPKERDSEVWARQGGHYGHFNAPLNVHSDPIVSIQSILDLAESAAPPQPDIEKEDQLFSQSPIESIHIVASHSMLVLTSIGDTHGAGVVQQKANGSLNQRWQVYGHEDGTVSFVNRAGDLALDRPDYATNAGLTLQVARCEFNDAQKWSYVSVGNTRRIWAPGTNRCIDMRGNTKSVGDAAQLWYGKSTDVDNQFFYWVPTI